MVSLYPRLSLRYRAGAILEKSDRVVQDKPIAGEDKSNDEDASADADVDDEPEEATIMDEVADFDSFTVWAHEALPDEKDSPFVRGVAEWVKFAEAVCGAHGTELDIVTDIDADAFVRAPS